MPVFFAQCACHDNKPFLQKNQAQNYTSTKTPVPRQLLRGTAFILISNIYGVTVFTFHPVNIYPGLGSGVGGTNVSPSVQDAGPDIVVLLSYHVKFTGGNREYCAVNILSSE